jgi:DNA-binding NtrC family response regulator
VGWVQCVSATMMAVTTELGASIVVDSRQADHTHGHRARAAQLLGLTRFQLYGRLKRYGIDVSPE